MKQACIDKMIYSLFRDIHTGRLENLLTKVHKTLLFILANVPQGTDSLNLKCPKHL